MLASHQMTDWMSTSNMRRGLLPSDNNAEPSISCDGVTIYRRTFKSWQVYYKILFVASTLLLSPRDSCRSTVISHSYLQLITHRTSKMTDVKTSHAEQLDRVNSIDNEKSAAARQNSFFDEEILKQKKEIGDYSGAVAKTDPAEIALVRKLDRWIMPM
jgi:hypothetical protein